MQHCLFSHYNVKNRKIMGEYVQNINGSFSLGGKLFRFIGANVFELANIESDVTRRVIDDAVKAGFKVLRFWLFQNRETGLIINKLNEICDMVRPHGIKLIVSLADKWGYLQNYKIDEPWYESGYKNEYLKYVTEVTSSCKDREEIMIWELINEPETDSFQSIYDFAKHVSEEIKSADPNHLLSIGTVGGIGDKFGGMLSVFKKSNFRKLYALRSIDAISLHDYSYDSGIFERLDMLYRFKGNAERGAIYGRIGEVIDSPFQKFDSWYLNRGKLAHFPVTLRGIWNSLNKKDIKFAKKMNKPVYIGEVGFKNFLKRDRAKILDADIREKFSLGIGGYMLWSFESQGWNNDGHGYGFGLKDGFEEVINKWNNKLL